MREDQKFLLGLLGKTESSNCEPATEQVGNVQFFAHFDSRIASR